MPVLKVFKDLVNKLFFKKRINWLLSRGSKTVVFSDIVVFEKIDQKVHFFMIIIYKGLNGKTPSWADFEKFH